MRGGHAVARPPSAGSNPVRARFVEFELDEANASLLRDGKPLALAPTPFALLCALARQPGTLLTKDALLDEVWGHQFVSESVLKTAVSDLRTALGDDPRQPRLIETVPRRGYRFIANPGTLAPAPPQQQPGAALAARELPAFVGRTEALARLQRAWSTASAGQRAVVWVAGEPGIGKTTLIDRFVAGLGGVAFARGQCVEHYGAAEPYLPVLEALADICRKDAALPALLRAVAPTWLLQLPWLSTPEEREALRRELAGVGPERMLRELAELGERYAERRPVLIVIEDLHWSDRSTIQLLDYLARRRGSARVMWLGSFRLAEIVAGEHPLNRVRHELRLHRLCEEIVLDPFSEKEIADYVGRQSRDLAANEAFVRALHERTDGVPLFVASVLGDVIARAGQYAGEAAAGTLANVPVPENVAGIIDHFLGRLDEDERALLATAAVCGTEFRPETVAAALGREAAWVGQTCERLARGQMWLAAPKAEEPADAAEQPYAFRHAFFREVLYERTPPLARAQAHRQVGAALEAERRQGRAVPPAQLAMHFDRGRDPATALRHYAEAAEAALWHLSPVECMELAQRALALLAQGAPGAERDTLEITLATLRGVAAVQALGVGTDAKEALQRAHALLDRVPQHPARAQLLHGFGFLLAMRGEYAEALEVAERAFALSEATQDPVLLLSACTIHGEVHMMQGRPRTARTWLERALPVMDGALAAAADQGFVAVPQAMLLGLLAVQLFHLGLLRQARARLREAHARAQEQRQPMAQLVVLWFDALLEVRLGNAQRVAKLAQETAALVEEFGLAQGRAAAQFFRGWAQARQGEGRAGHALVREAYGANTATGMRAGGTEVLGYAAEALLRAGDPEGAARELGEALQLVESQAERVYLPQLLLIEADIARARRQEAAADASLRRALAEARAQEAPWHELVVLVELCEHGDAQASERQALAALLEALPEAAGTTIAARARSLLPLT
jgi:DNA-binding winged helix-turn-helix (wHTH) protein